MQRSFSQPDLFKAFWMIGICGGFTTFSAFGIELFDWLENGRWRTGILYAGPMFWAHFFYISRVSLRHMVEFWLS